MRGPASQADAPLCAMLHCCSERSLGAVAPLTTAAARAGNKAKPNSANSQNNKEQVGPE